LREQPAKYAVSIALLEMTNIITSIANMQIQFSTATSEPTGEQEAIVAAICKKFTRLFFEQPIQREALQLTLPESFCVLRYGDALYVNTFRDIFDDEDAMMSHIRRNQTSGSAPIESSFEIWLHDNIAAVVSRNAVHVDGRDPSHRTNIFSLLKDSSQWRIVGLTGCKWRYDTTSQRALSEKEVMAPVERLFDSLTRYDWDGLVVDLLPSAGATLSRRPQPPLAVVWPDFVERLKRVVDALPPGSVIQEKIHNSKVRVCGDLALVWAPFIVELDGQLRSTGLNIFTLMKQDEKWVISGLQDTQDI
jgi:hypothetical protein